MVIESGRAVTELIVCPKDMKTRSGRNKPDVSVVDQQMNRAVDCGDVSADSPTATTGTSQDTERSGTDSGEEQIVYVVTCLKPDLKDNDTKRVITELNNAHTNYYNTRDNPDSTEEQVELALELYLEKNYNSG